MKALYLILFLTAITYSATAQKAKKSESKAQWYQIETKKGSIKSYTNGFLMTINHGKGKKGASLKIATDDKQVIDGYTEVEWTVHAGSPSSGPQAQNGPSVSHDVSVSADGRDVTISTTTTSTTADGGTKTETKSKTISSDGSSSGSTTVQVTNSNGNITTTVVTED